MDVAWIREMREKYEAQGIRVVVKEVSPLPDCDSQLGLFQRELAPYVDSNVQALPIGRFNDSDRHMTLEGARIESLELAGSDSRAGKASNVNSGSGGNGDPR